MQIDFWPHLKTAVGATPPRVRISPLPPSNNGKIRTFSPAKSGTSRFALNAKSEQNAPNSEYNIPKNEYSMFAIRSRRAA